MQFLFCHITEVCSHSMQESDVTAFEAPGLISLKATGGIKLIISEYGLTGGDAYWISAEGMDEGDASWMRAGGGAAPLSASSLLI